MPYSLVFNYICISSPKEAKFLYIYLLRAISWLVAQTSSTYLHEYACSNHHACLNIYVNTFQNLQEVNLWLNLDARNYMWAPKIWPSHNLKFESNCKCYIWHNEEIWEIHGEWKIMHLCLNMANSSPFFNANFGVPRKK